MIIPLDLPWYTIDGWQGNVLDDYGVEWIVTSEDGWSVAPPARSDVQDRPDDDGGDDSPTYESPRVITLEGTAIATSRRAQNIAKDRINACAYGSATALYDLTVTEAHVTRFSRVRRSGAAKITDRGSLAFEWSLTFVAPDPARYDVIAAQSNAALGQAQVATTGRVYPRVYPLAYEVAPTSGGGLASATVFNLGNRTTGGVIQFFGGVKDPSITNLETGEELAFQLNVPADTFLEVDLTTRSVLLGGTASRRATLATESAWFKFRPGNTRVRFDGTPLSDSTPQMRISYRSAWK